ncbi:Flagellar system sigma 54-dependent response regulator FlbD [hydrothermal vent metagenome]|uniref:Flagellar system sigma 54-dependent response regulator FlbD n=1 Tax=hydrothermal vent metagenome TaxID=652676 RepID=A0A3B0RYP3_9ZZZZ
MRILIVGCLSGQLSEATKIAMDQGAKVAQVDSSEAALKALRAGQGADMLLVEISVKIADLLSALKTERIHIPIVACGISATPKEAAAAIRAGAREFIPLPPDADLIAAVLASVADDNKSMLARDPVMRKVVAFAEQVASANASILITGESGSGKEVMARHVHEKSKRANKPFISINCAAIPENLLESELFGHEKGAFTGAVARRIGKFEEANGGTLLLDEISEMDGRLQAKLLRAIQEREIDRVGGSTPVKVDIRILATSNRDLAQAVRDGSFREDLLFRLNVVNLIIPPLRDRPADIIPLAEHFISKYSAANGVLARPLSEAARHCILNQHWAGNVRELENAMHRAVLLASGDIIDAEAMRAPDGTRLNESAGSSLIADAVTGAVGSGAMAAGLSHVGQTVASVEQGLILETLEHCLGNRTHAANILGISIRTLRNKLKLYAQSGIEVPLPGENRHLGVAQAG